VKDRALRRRNALRCAAAAALALAASACGMLPPANLEPPKISIANISIVAVGLEELRFALSIDARNPNDVDVPLTNLRFDLELLGQPFASGAAAESTVTLPAGASREVPIEFAVPTSRLLDLVRALRHSAGSPLGYRLHGSANWGRSPFAIPFEKRGEFDALRRLRERLEPPRRT